MIRVNPFPLVTVLLAAAFVVSSCSQGPGTSSGVVQDNADGMTSSGGTSVSSVSGGSSGSGVSTALANSSASLSAGSSLVSASNSLLTSAFCGDAIVNSAAEQCDDGNGDDTDTCSNSCLTQERVDGPSVTSPSRSQDYYDCIASGADAAECEEL